MTIEDTFLQDILKDPGDTGPQRIYADWLEEQERTEEARALRAGRILCLPDSLVYRAIIHLGLCRFLPGSADKRFVRRLLGRTLDLSQKGLTVKQWAYLWRLVWRYRKQILALVAGSRGHLLPRVVAEVVARAALLLDKEPSPPRRPRSLFNDVEAP